MTERRAAVWSAVSTEQQATERKESLANQKREGSEAARRIGATVVAELEVPGKSRSIDSLEEAAERIEAYAQLLDLINRRAIDVLICRDMSRLGRTISLVTSIIRRCKRAGILVYPLNAPPASLDPSAQADDDGFTIVSAVLASYAQMEAETLARRRRKGMEWRAQQGLFPRGVPWGWCETPEGVEVDPHAASAIHLFCRLYLEGRSHGDIAKEMARLGYTTASGKPWSWTQCREVARYIWRFAGYIEYNVQSKHGRPYMRVLGRHPAIIDEEMAQRIEREREHRAAARRAVSSPYRYTSTLVCGKCGSRMHGHQTAAKRKSGASYICSKLCAGSVTGEPELNEALGKLLEELARWEDEKLRDFAAQHDTRAPQLRADLEAAHAEVEKVKEEKRTLTRLAMSGRMDDDTVLDMMDELRAREAGIAERITKLEADLAAEKDQDGKVQRLAEARDAGTDILQADRNKFNAWLRRHFRIICADGQIDFHPL